MGSPGVENFQSHLHSQYQIFILRFNLMYMVSQYQIFILRFNLMYTVSQYQLHGSQSPIKLLRVSHCPIKFYLFNMVQPIDLIFCKMVEITEQNIFNRADFFI